MERLQVRLRGTVDDSYPIFIGRSMFALAASWIKKSGSGRVAVITDSNVAKLHSGKFLRALSEAGVPAEIFVFRAGEASKSRATKEALEDAMARKRFGRDTLVAALGGGVVGDLAGFTASTYMRGVPFIQVPTTLLAMVDSSIGGKTGVDTPVGKNLVGTFCQPEAVFIDTGTLATLGQKEMLDGAVEMAKHAVIAGGEYFAFLRGNARAILSGNGAALERAIKRSCEIKRDIVETDEKEKRLRKSLNLGHTLGHAIEKASGYRISHGTAVGLGIIAETRIAEKLGLLGRETASEITGLMETLGIRKEALKKLDARAVVRNTLYDKKNTGKVVNYVLPAAIGKVRIGVKVPAGLVLSVLQTA